MKIRDGFVSNSSSTAFILDLRSPGVKEFVEANRDVQKPRGLGRQTSLAVGEFAIEYARDWIVGTSEWKGFAGGLGHWILEWAGKLGENVVFARESDEGMGGFLNGDPSPLAVAEKEYH